MKHFKVESSNIFSLGYDPDRKALQLRFHTGGVAGLQAYEYSDVEPSEVIELLFGKSAPSVGQRSRAIKSAHPSPLKFDYIPEVGKP